MARKPFYCGRCGGSFHTASKYCPACGAMLSLPLGSRARAGAAAGPDKSLRRSGWLEVIIIMALLFVALYFGIKAVRQRNAEVMYNVVTEVRYVDVIDNTVYDRAEVSLLLTAEELDSYDPQTVIYGLKPEHEKLYGHLPLDVVRSMVERGQLPGMPPGHSTREDPGDGGQNAVIVNPDAPGARDDSNPLYRPEYRLRNNSVTEHHPDVEPGMTHGQVMSAWGRPQETGTIPRDGTRFERWYFGDPIYNIDVGTRYVEFGPDGRVDMVLDGDTVLRAPGNSAR